MIPVLVLVLVVLVVVGATRGRRKARSAEPTPVVLASTPREKRGAPARFGGARGSM